MNPMTNKNIPMKLLTVSVPVDYADKFIELVEVVNGSVIVDHLNSPVTNKKTTPIKPGQLTGKYLKKFREKYNLTQQMIAKKIGVTGPTISKFENGKSTVIGEEVKNKIIKFMFETINA